MWIFSKYGFYSIVEKPKGTFQVRSRHEQDLNNLKAVVGLPHEIRSDIGTDYEYRILVNAETVQNIMDLLGRSINYDNFKDEVEKNPDQLSKLDAYHQIWSQMLYTTNTYRKYPRYETVGIKEDDVDFISRNYLNLLDEDEF